MQIITCLKWKEGKRLYNARWLHIPLQFSLNGSRGMINTELNDQRKNFLGKSDKKIMLPQQL